MGVSDALKTLVVEFSCIVLNPGLFHSPVGILTTDAVAALLCGATAIQQAFNLELQSIDLVLQNHQLLLLIATP